MNIPLFLSHIFKNMFREYKSNSTCVKIRITLNTFVILKISISLQKRINSFTQANPGTLRLVTYKKLTDKQLKFPGWRCFPPEPEYNLKTISGNTENTVDDGNDCEH